MRPSAAVRSARRRSNSCLTPRSLVGSEPHGQAVDVPEAPPAVDPPGISGTPLKAADPTLDYGRNLVAPGCVECRALPYFAQGCVPEVRDYWRRGLRIPYPPP